MTSLSHPPLLSSTPTHSNTGHRRDTQHHLEHQPPPLLQSVTAFAAATSPYTPPLRPKQTHTHLHTTSAELHSTTTRSMATTTSTARPGSSSSSSSVKEWNDRLAAYIKSLEQEQVIRNPGTYTYIYPSSLPPSNQTHTHTYTHISLTPQQQTAKSASPTAKLPRHWRRPPYASPPMQKRPN
jgi:hypothetical protein